MKTALIVATAAGMATLAHGQNDSYGSYGSYGSHVAPPACLRDCSNFDRISTGEVDDCAITSSWVEDSCVSDCYGEDLAALDFFVDDFCAAAEPNCGEDNDSLVFEICRNSEGCPVELFRTCEAVRDADASGNPGNCYDFALQQPGNPDGIQPCPETCGCPCRSDPTKCRTDGDDCWGPRYEPRECADGYFAAVDWHKGEGYGELLCFEPRCEYEAYDRGDECQPQDAKCRTYGDDCWGASSEPRDCADDFVAGIDWDDDKLLCFPPGCEPYDKGMPTCMQCDAHKDRQLQFARLPCC